MEFRLVAEWLLAIAVLTGAGAPIAALLFPRLPRRGAAFALPAALVPFAVVVFWIGQVGFGRATVLVALLAVLAAGIGSYVAGGVPRWRPVAGAYGVFVLGFGFLVLFRAYDPGITPAGGEQFLHFGVVKSMLRAGSLPPEDFWFAGEPLRYYYGTQMQVAALASLVDVDPRYGFNLAIPTFYGLLFVVAYGLAGSVVAAAGRSYHLGGALGAFFVAVGGSLTTSVRLGFGLLPRELALEYGHAAFGAVRHMPYEEAVARLSDPAEWGWFYTRYVVPDTLQEFPLYSFVKADLHGHALTTGYLLFAAALAFSYYLTPADQRRRRLGVLFGGMGLVAGVFGFSNTWSLPSTVGLAWLALAAADPHPATLFPDRLAGRLGPFGADGPDRLARRAAGELWRIVLAGVLAVLVGLVGVAVASPFLVFGDVPTNDGVGLFPPRTELAPFLVIYGGLVALFAGFLTYVAAPRLRGHLGREGIETATGLAIAGAAAIVVAGLALDFPVLAVTGPILLAAWWLVRTGRLGFEGVLLVAGVGLVLSIELVYAKVWPPDEIRWNTSLKVAVQGWTLAGAAAGAAAAILVSDGLDRLAALRTVRGDGDPSSGDRATGVRWRSIAAGAIAVLLVASTVATAAAFPVLVTNNHVLEPDSDPDVEPSLDGLATHDRWRAEEMAAIHWLDDREGTPTIVEAPGHATYRWTSPASTLTGLPTVVGWDHQRGYRGNEAFERRAEQVDTVYVGPWEEAADVLRRHDVRYVYVGPNERDYGEDLRAFDREAFSVAFENDQVTIYAVNQSALPE